MTPTADITMKVWGDYACFSRPECQTDQVSYPVITPAAARGVMEAIFWKPEIRYEIREIVVLRLGSQTTLSRGRVLKDVEYLIHGTIRLRERTLHPIPRYVDQFARRLARGKCFRRPYLGTREFTANFGPATGHERPESLNRYVGPMLFDIAFVKTAKPDTKQTLAFWEHSPGRRCKVKGEAHALFFDAQITEGRLVVPAQRYRELYSMEQKHG